MIRSFVCSVRGTCVYDSVAALCFSFFFLIRRRPPRSTLFPYPTLCRSRSSSPPARPRPPHRPRPPSSSPAGSPSRSSTTPRRSEEHTSELQSRQYLVCRLLLEKKKNRTPTYATQPVSTTSSIVIPTA